MSTSFPYGFWAKTSGAKIKKVLLLVSKMNQNILSFTNITWCSTCSHHHAGVNNF